MGKSLVRAIAVAVALGVWSAASLAAGLGKLTVISSLGQPFRAEIDLVAVKKDELSSLGVRLASPDAFRQAELPYTAYVSNIKLAIETRPNGDPYVKVSSYQPLDEPFIDFLVELNWTSGRLVRAYTALVDPPVVTDAEVATTAPTPPAPAPVVVPVPTEPAPVAVAPVPEPMPVAPSAPRAPAPATPPPAADRGGPGSIVVPDHDDAADHDDVPAPVAENSEVVTKKGDTLSKIAKDHKPEDVSLEQMLVLLYRDNPDAFSGKNMNRLKTGKVLRLPDAAALAEVSPAEATKEVRVQAANWNAYREKLAAMAGETPAMDEPGDQSAAGKVTTKVEDAMPAATEPAKEVLKLSKGESGAAAAGGNGKAAADRVRALEEEVAAKDRAVKDANERVASLEKTIKDMQALMEMKSQGMSDLQKPAADKVPPAKTEAPVAAPAPTPAPEPAPEAAAPTEEQPAIATMPEPEPAPAPAPKKIVPPPPPPPPPPSFLDQILADPTYVVGAGAALALVGGGALLYLLRKKRAGGDVPPKKKKKGKKGAAEAEEGDAIAEDGGPTTDDELPASQLAAAGDAHEDGDPLAEAEIFLTYGRDNLAEDRLREAIAANPRRFELHAKLLEIYANRQDLVAFEQVAKELQIGTASKGDLWARAVRLGYSLDPGNPRYAAGRPAEGEVAAAAVGGAALAAGALDASKTNLDFNLGFDDGGSGTTTDIDLGELGPDIRAASSVGTPTDIDLGELGGPGGGDIFDPGIGMQPPVDHESTVQMTSFGGSGNTMDLGGLDLTGDIFPDESTSAAAPQPTTSSSPAELDFDLDAAPTSVSGEPSDPDGGLAFDLSGLDLDAPAAGSGAPGAANMPDLDLSGINLDLDGTGSGTATGGKDDKWYDVQTKFDLAKAYQEMGDKEGAREILQEVVAEGDAEQKSAAQSVLASLG